MTYFGPYYPKELKDREPTVARNRVQFQKGYSLVQFMDEYGSEEKCMESLFRWRWPNGFVCPRCEHTEHWRHQSRALYQCCGCRLQVSLMAGTIFASTKLPLRTWSLAMFLMTQTKNGVTVAVRDRKWTAQRPASRAHLGQRDSGQRQTLHTYHHFRSKHLPRYLAEFSHRFSRRFSLREMFPRLSFVALRTAPMSYRVLKLAKNYF